MYLSLVTENEENSNHTCYYPVKCLTHWSMQIVGMDISVNLCIIK